MPDRNDSMIIFGIFIAVPNVSNLTDHHSHILRDYTIKIRSGVTAMYSTLAEVIGTCNRNRTSFYDLVLTMLVVEEDRVQFGLITTVHPALVPKGLEHGLDPQPTYRILDLPMNRTLASNTSEACTEMLSQKLGF